MSIFNPTKTTIKKYAGLGFDIRLKRYMLAKGLISKTLAKTLGVSVGTVDYWRSGRRYPHVHTLSRLALAMNAHDFYWLITGVETNDKS